MRPLVFFGFLIALMGVLFAFGSLGLGVYMGGFTEDGLSENALIALVVSGCVGLLAGLFGMAMLEEEAKKDTTEKESLSASSKKKSNETPDSSN